MSYTTKDLAKFISEKMDTLTSDQYTKVQHEWNLSVPLVDLVNDGYIQAVTADGRNAMEELYNFLEFPENWNNSL